MRSGSLADAARLICAIVSPVRWTSRSYKSVPDLYNSAVILPWGRSFPSRVSSEVETIPIFLIVRQYVLPWGFVTPPCDWCWSFQHRTL